MRNSLFNLNKTFSELKPCWFAKISFLLRVLLWLFSFAFIGLFFSVHYNPKLFEFSDSTRILIDYFFLLSFPVFISAFLAIFFKRFTFHVIPPVMAVYLLDKLMMKDFEAITSSAQKGINLLEKIEISQIALVIFVYSVCSILFYFWDEMKIRKIYIRQLQNWTEISPLKND